jgi:uroporphyrin-III C-methyltransferase/precorrin-2 dehydrogenase/sirohydrochlorin ferrochelatase
MAQVSLVGAGPGDPELWTVGAVRRLREADLVLYDALVDARALREATRAPCLCVGKRAGRASVRQETINRLMIAAARRGRRVVRLKGGDPFVFGRGGEEALALRAAGVPFEVVPGVSSAIAAPALAGIPVTHRGLSSGVLVVAGHAPEAFEAAIGAVVPNQLTLVVMMGLRERATTAAMLVARGWRPATPAAIVSGASTADTATWTGTLSCLGAAPAPEGAPGVIVVGEVVRLRQAISGSFRLQAEEWLPARSFRLQAEEWLPASAGSDGGAHVGR